MTGNSVQFMLLKKQYGTTWYTKALFFVCSMKSERLRQVGAVVDSTPVLPDTDTVKSFLASQQHNSGVISMLFDFVKLMALHYNHKW